MPAAVAYSGPSRTGYPDGHAACRRGQRGSLLIFSIWTLALLSIFVLASGGAVRQRIRFVQVLDERENLRWIAEAGILRAIQAIDSKPPEPRRPDGLADDWANHPGWFRDVAVGRGTFTVSWEQKPLSRERDSGAAVFYGGQDEESKLNLNQVDSLQVLTRLFEAAAGLDKAEAGKIAAAVIDWRDEDDNPYADGAESGEYDRLGVRWRPKNAPYDTLEEVRFVRGMTPDLLRSVAPYLSLDSNGQLNVNTVSEPVLKAYGFSDSLIHKLMAFRAGPDGKAGTKDDRAFERVSDIAPVLGRSQYLSEDERASLESFAGSGILAVESQNFQIRSVARLNGRERTFEILCVVSRRGPVKRWQEKYS